MKKSKDYIITVIILLASLMLITVLPTEAEAKIYSDTVRLHILANSDSEEDQRLKLGIRDKVLEKYSSRLAGYSSSDEAKAHAAEYIEEIEKDVAAWIREAGYSYSAEVTLTEEWYDTRSYGEVTLPSGRYTSLRILIGKAEGKNWWCVMYPPLCLDIATENAPSDDAYINFTDEETRLVTSSGYNIKFKLLELISGAVEYFSKNG